MSEPWALTVSAADVDAAARAEIAGEVEEWQAAGGGGVALVTCHRVELYGFGRLPLRGMPHMLRGRQAVAHLLRVACGLESAVVGEDEVLHQVREALVRARLEQDADRRLHRLFETAIATGRKARSGRTESSGNLAQGAVAWLSTRADIAGGMVVVAGAGRMGAVLAHSLVRSGAQVIIASRDVTKAARLARIHAGRGMDLRGGAEWAGRAAAVAVALGGPWDELGAVAGPKLPPIADISAPTAVPEQVRRRANGGFLSIDDLYRRDKPPPGAYIKDAERLVALRTSEYLHWLERAG